MRKYAMLKNHLVGIAGEILPIDDEVQENVKKVVNTNPQLIDFHKVKAIPHRKVGAILPEVI